MIITFHQILLPRSLNQPTSVVDSALCICIAHPLPVDHSLHALFTLGSPLSQGTFQGIVTVLKHLGDVLWVTREDSCHLRTRVVTLLYELAPIVVARC